MATEQLQRLRLRRQWVLSPKDVATAAPRGWPTVPLHRGYQLAHHPEVRVTRAVVGDRTALLLGAAVSSNTHESPQAWLYDLAAAVPPDRPALLHRLAGTYTVITSDAIDVRLYTDPAGMMQGFVRDGVVASSPALFHDLEPDEELATRFPFGPDNDWYPGDLTAFRDLRAVRANHELSVTDGTVTRFWPRTQPGSVSADVGTMQLASLLRRLVHGLIDVGPVLCSLTGGKDSRVNLASLRGRTGDVRFFTLAGVGAPSCDARTAASLARRFAIPHDLIPSEVTPDWLLHVYDEVTSATSVGARREVMGRLLRYLDDGAIHLNGNLGALAKGFFWHGRRPNEVRPRALLKEFVDRPPAIRAAVAGWLASVPDLPAPTTYNLMYLEQRGGRWMGPGEAASGIIYDSFSPFCSREVFDIISSVPAEFQSSGKLLMAIVEESWPELLDVPYCRSPRSWSRHVPRSAKNRLKRVVGRRVPAGGISKHREPPQ